MMASTSTIEGRLLQSPRLWSNTGLASESVAPERPRLHNPDAYRGTLMRNVRLATAVLGGVIMCTLGSGRAPADDLARDASDRVQVQAPDESLDRWRFAVTPRLQALYFVPHLGEFGYTSVMPSAGLSVVLQKPTSPLSFSATYFFGEADVTYVDRQITFSRLNYTAIRSDAAGYIEYTPDESNITFLAGLRYVYMPFRERAQAPVVFTSNYDVSIATAEVGFRIAGRMSAGSPHAFSAQITAGLGYGAYSERTTGLAPLDINNLALTGEIAFGYTYLMTDHLSFGARVRGFLYEIQGNQPGRPANQFGEHAGGAFGPEVNFTYRF